MDVKTYLRLGDWNNLWNQRLPYSLRTQTYFLSSLLSTQEYSDDRKYAFVRRLHRLPILTRHFLGDVARHLLYRDDFSFSCFSLLFRDFRITTKGNTNPDLLYGLDFVLIHMDCSTVIVLMFAHKVLLLYAPFYLCLCTVLCKIVYFP